jgi:hypothetical protein
MEHHGAVEGSAASRFENYEHAAIRARLCPVVSAGAPSRHGFFDRWSLGDAARRPRAAIRNAPGGFSVTSFRAHEPSANLPRCPAAFRPQRERRRAEERAHGVTPNSIPDQLFLEAPGKQAQVRLVLGSLSLTPKEIAFNMLSLGAKTEFEEAVNGVVGQGALPATLARGKGRMRSQPAELWYASVPLTKGLALWIFAGVQDTAPPKRKTELVSILRSVKVNGPPKIQRPPVTSP